MVLEVKEKLITEVGCEEIYSGYFQTYELKLNIEEKLKEYMCKVQFATAGQETVEITYVEGQTNYLPQAPAPGDYAIKIVFYDIVDGALKQRYSLPEFHKIIKRGSFDGELGRDPTPEDLDQFNKILAETVKTKNEVEKIEIEVEADRKEVSNNTKIVEDIANGIQEADLVNKVKNLELNKLDKSGYEPDKYLGTDSKGNVITREGLDNVTKKYVDEQDVKTLTEAKIYTTNELQRPQHNTMIVTAMQEGIGFKSDYTANEIKRHADGGGVVILRFNAPDGSGEQSYNYETFKNNTAIFRRTILYKQTDLIKRIIIAIDNRYNINKKEEEIQIATSGDLANANDEINYLTEEASRHEQDIMLIRTEITQIKASLTDIISRLVALGG